MSYANGFTQIELDKFGALPDVEIVFDIGAKDNVEYLEIKPEASFHLFEPMGASFEVLKEKVIKGGWKKVVLNNFGIADVNGELGFNNTSEAFEGSPANTATGGGNPLPVRKLDDYIEEHKIRQIDFMKMDTEGLELKIIQGNPKAIGMTRYLQYEHWANDGAIREALGGNFTFEDIGARNIFCTRKYD